jgi:hypothetical protein
MRTRHRPMRPIRQPSDSPGQVAADPAVQRRPRHTRRDGVLDHRRPRLTPPGLRPNVAPPPTTRPAPIRPPRAWDAPRTSGSEWPKPITVAHHLASMCRTSGGTGHAALAAACRIGLYQGQGPGPVGRRSVGPLSGRIRRSWLGRIDSLAWAGSLPETPPSDGASCPSPRCLVARQ